MFQPSNSQYGYLHEAKDLVLREQSAWRCVLSPIGLCPLSAAGLAPRGLRRNENRWFQPLSVDPRKSIIGYGILPGTWGDNVGRQPIAFRPLALFSPHANGGQVTGKGPPRAQRSKP